ncbi:hypothetical protein CA13_05440 [Planctomycetes bacterium CA13]|uniref:Transposase DDE domain-containing protein n=1 Tax=Novipirellula herctigrandis TaxID=2527986 RepID=A0A5C5YWI9_9BACT|nr:hypothetical protein CA13_05440 [Planctomycetes bacterium CA13]
MLGIGVTALPIPHRTKASQSQSVNENAPSRKRLRWQAVEVDFDGGTLNSDGGYLLIREIDRRLDLVRRCDKNDVNDVFGLQKNNVLGRKLACELARARIRQAHSGGKWPPHERQLGLPAFATSPLDHDPMGQLDGDPMGQLDGVDCRRSACDDRYRSPAERPPNLARVPVVDQQRSLEDATRDCMTTNAS